MTGLFKQIQRLKSVASNYLQPNLSEASGTPISQQGESLPPFYQRGVTEASRRFAIRVLEAEISNNPSNRLAYSELISLFITSGSSDKALDACNRMRLAFNDDADSIIEELAALLRIGRYDDASILADRFAHRLEPDILRPGVVTRLLEEFVSSEAFTELSVGDFSKIFLSRYLSRSILQEMTAIRSFTNRSYYDAFVRLAALHVEQAGAIFLYVTFDRVCEIKNRSSGELAITEAETLKANGELDKKSWLGSVPPHIAAAHADLPYFSKDYWVSILHGPPNIISGARVATSDCEGDFVNVANGMRKTTDQPKFRKNTIAVFGTSDVFCTGCEDTYTLPSQIQRKINKSHPNTYRVENHGLRGASMADIVLNVLAHSFHKGDICILVGHQPLEPTSEAHLNSEHLDFSRPHEHGEIYNDDSHFNWIGTGVTASKVVDLLFDDSGAGKIGIRSAVSLDRGVPSQLSTANGFLEYLKYVYFLSEANGCEADEIQRYEEYLIENSFHEPGSVGSVAVNCNPITLGHLHLLKYASKQVDVLYVFVIEEDKSYFSFEDRLYLVREALSDLENVRVLKGGRYICTQFTYPEYYTKEEAGDLRADASQEAWYFCEHIAKPLNIRKIFLGDEPTCLITRQYNEQMAELLPQYQIEVDIIPRIDIGNKTVSASTVRALLKDGNFKEIKEIVPEVTYDFLSEKFNPQNRRIAQ